MNEMLKVLSKYRASMMISNLDDDIWHMTVKYPVMGGIGTSQFTFRPKEGTEGDVEGLPNIPELIDKELEKHMEGIRTEQAEEFMEQEGLE